LPGRLLFDVSALVQWYSYFSNPIGVPRVTQNILGSAPISANPNVEFIARGPGSQRFYRVPKQTVRDLSDPDRRMAAVANLRGLFARSMMLGNIRDLLREATFSRLPYYLLGLSKLSRIWEIWCAKSIHHLPVNLVLLGSVTEHDIIINLGDFWSQRFLVDALIALKKSSGAPLVHMMHDLFPISRPKSIHPFFSQIWRDQFENLVPHVDRWMTNSEFVRQDLLGFLAQRHLESRPITVIPMGSDSFALKSEDNSQSDSQVLSKFGLAHKSYVLHVGTVEARKNIMPLIDAMTALRHRRSGRTPALVLIGGVGWQSKEVVDRLKATANEGGTVSWLRDVTDRELPALYRGASFSVIPGLLEGWGLPVRESLIHGVPCIVSSAGALPEAGGDLAVYFDPRDPAGLQSALEGWIGDSDALEEARTQLARRLKEGLKFPTWDDAGDTVLRVLGTLR
jgi:glycosyltransferase involved in cell wall biosynthesis